MKKTGHELWEVWECCECNPEELSEEDFTNSRNHTTVIIDKGKGGETMTNEEREELLALRATKASIDTFNPDRLAELEKKAADAFIASEEERIAQEAETARLAEEARVAEQAAQEAQATVENVTEEVPTTEVPVEGQVDSTGVETVVEEQAVG